MSTTWNDELHKTYEAICSDLKEDLRCMLQELPRDEQELVCDKLQDEFRFWRAE